MSGSVSAGVTPAETVDIRRWCGYPPLSRTIGVDVVGRALVALSAEEVAAARNVFLAQLPTLEMAIPGSSGLLNTDTAGPFKRNVNELTDRDSLFRMWRLRLCYAIGIDPGPLLDLELPAIFLV